MTEQGLMNRATVTELVSAYSEAEAMVNQAYDLLKKSRERLELAYGDHYTDFSTMPARCYSGEEVVAQEVMEKIKKHAWRCIIDRLGIKKVLSSKRADELDKKLENGKDMPPLTVESIFAHLEMLVDQRKDYAAEAVKEVYELLRPASRGNQAYGHRYKTNDKNGKYNIGKKVILSWKIEGSYSREYPFRVCYQYGENDLRALDKVFHLLDGSGIPDGYKSELIDAINTSHDGTGQTEYFKFRACHNRNLHIEFRRMDLVTKLNQIAGDPTQLKG